MTKVKKCSQCGKEVPQGGTFCPFCGNIININGKVESRESGRCEVDDDIQKKYRNDINQKYLRNLLFDLETDPHNINSPMA